MTDKLYRVAANGEEIGEYKMDDLCSYWQSGQLGPDTVYLHEGTQTWKPLSKIVTARVQSERMAAKTQAQFMARPRTSYGAIPVTTRAAPSDKARWMYILLALFVGGLGLHNFYAGHNLRGFVQLLITLLGGWMLYPLIVVFIWVVAEIFIETTDGAGRPFA